MLEKHYRIVVKHTDSGTRLPGFEFINSATFGLLRTVFMTPFSHL